jgi:hypothetical protein
MQMFEQTYNEIKELQNPKRFTEIPTEVHEQRLLEFMRIQDIQELEQKDRFSVDFFDDFGFNRSSIEPPSINEET